MAHFRFGICAALLLFVSTPATEGAKPITMKGSDTMVILGQRWAEQYMNANAGQVIMVSGGGSGTGIASLINGTTDVCMASRPMKPDEKLKLRDRYQTLGVELPVARDGLSVYVHEGNPVRDLSLEQLRAIYMGAVTNWKQVGGRDATIILYSRENNSGTYVYFKDNVLGGRDFSPRAQTLPGTAAVVNAVARDPNGIGYGGHAYTRGVRICALRRKAGEAALEPSLATVRDGRYPLSRDLYLYTRRKPDKELKAFVDWVLSPAGQEIASQVGYYPLR